MGVGPTSERDTADLTFQTHTTFNEVCDTVAPDSKRPPRARAPCCLGDGSHIQKCFHRPFVIYFYISISKIVFHEGTTPHVLNTGFLEGFIIVPHTVSFFSTVYSMVNEKMNCCGFSIGIGDNLMAF